MRTQDEDGFRAFVQQEWGPLTRTAYLLTGDRNYAEDLVQTALEKTHRKWDNLSGLDTPAAYVRKTMVNTAISWRRRRSAGEVPQEPKDTAHTPDQYAQLEQRHELLVALRKLPPKMRAVLVLRYFEDLSDAQVAQTLGCSVGTVKSQASRGLQRLRDAFSESGNPLTTALQGS